MPPNNQNSEQTSILNSSELGVDAETLWQAADKLRGSIDAAEYKHVVLGLIFLKSLGLIGSGPAPQSWGTAER
jgi:hypothetical protein